VKEKRMKEEMKKLNANFGGEILNERCEIIIHNSELIKER